MGSAKDIVLRPITSQEARELVRRVHYSGKIVNNSSLHIGVFWNGKLEGAMQFGPSLDKRKMTGLVEGTGWNEFLELNRMAFTDALPRNSESRALSIAIKLIRKHAPHVKWIVTFADGAQCGDGTIYRAAGFVLTGIKRNEALYLLPSGEAIHEWQLRVNATAIRDKVLALGRGSSSLTAMRKETGIAPIPGYQLRYIYFIDPTCRERLTVPVLPFSEIEKRGAGMYRGQPRAGSIDSDAPGFHPGEGGATPTSALQGSAAD